MMPLSSKILKTKLRNKKSRVVVAMSGGVDSSVAAALQVELGHEVVGVTLQLYDHGVNNKKAGSCCAGQDIRDARRVAEQLGIAHYVLDYEKQFMTDVMEDFADSYLRGETPIPCIRCNQTVKFRDLIKVSMDLNAEYLVTGHYVRRVMGELGAELHQAFDVQKDQSYFLFATTQSQLEFLRFPLGDITKEEVRDHAARMGLMVSKKPDSQDICFVPNGNYVSIIEKLRPGASKPGNIIGLKGEVMGGHDGIINFTVGQRKGIGIGSKEALYVLEVNAKTNEVLVGPKTALFCDRISLNNSLFLDKRITPGTTRQVIVRLRSTHSGTPALLCNKIDGSFEIHLLEPDISTSAGQAAVCYDGTRVLGGGWISKSWRSNSTLKQEVA